MCQPSCCFQCPKRTETCHTTCSQHIAEKLVNEILAMQEYKDRCREYDHTVFVMNRIHKCQKAKRAAGYRVRRAIGRR